MNKLMDTLDISTQENFPVVIAPHAGPISAPTKEGTRFILGRHGIFKEISTFWMVRRKLHAQCPLPYGEVHESLKFVFPAPPTQLWREFIAKSQAAFPLECAGLMVWSHATQEWRLVMRRAMFSTGDWVDYENPALDGDDVAVVDIHSHGAHGAFFSAQDNRDDSGGIKISAVVGRVNQPTPEIMLRLVVIDEFIPVEFTKDGQFQPRIRRILNDL